MRAAQRSAGIRKFNEDLSELTRPVGTHSRTRRVIDWEGQLDDMV